MSNFLEKGMNYTLGRWALARNQWRKFLRRRYPDQHQLTSTTEMNRYPELFRAVRERWPGDQPRILSYGCSTGEECATLENYFQPGLIVGADINEDNLREARKRFSSPRLHFVQSDPAILMTYGPFDIVFALSVLCRWEDTRDVEDCTAIYSFEKFASATALLDLLVAPGGLLVIYNSNFRFEDTITYSASYSIEATPALTDSGFVHKFDQHNRRIREVHRVCIYRKVDRA
jgi:hypothetical protein